MIGFSLPNLQIMTIDPTWACNKGIRSDHVGGLYQDSVF